MIGGYYSGLGCIKLQVAPLRHVSLGPGAAPTPTLLEVCFAGEPRAGGFQAKHVKGDRESPPGPLDCCLVAAARALAFGAVSF